MSIFSYFRQTPQERRIAHDNARTYRMIRSLPLEIQKDIGWPDVEQIRRRNGSGDNM